MYIDAYEAEYLDEKTKDWKPCRVVGVCKGDHSSVLEFIVLITKRQIQSIDRVENVRLPDPLL